MKPSVHLLLFVLAAIIGCTDDVAPLSPAQRQAVAAYVSKVAPSPEHELDIRFENKVRLLGYELDREQWKPGETMRVTWYWKAEQALGKEWKLFTHIVDEEQGRTLNQDGNGTLRWLYGPDRWAAGEYVRDAQDLHLPRDWTGTSATIYVGLWRDGQRLSITTGPSDGEGRARAVTIPTPVQSPASDAQPDLPELVVVQTRRPPRLDGSLTDPVWSFANTTRAFVETRKGGVAPVRASARLLWDKRYLYVGVDVKDALLRATHREHDDHLWEQDCVELMIDPDGDGKNYFEIQVSPRGVVFDTRYDARRVPEPFGHTDWDSAIRVGVSPRGKVDDAESDAGYTVEMAIPWHSFSLKGTRATPPNVGDKWRANLYVMDLNRDRQEAAAWSPPGIDDFHVPGRFGILTFAGPPGDMVGPIEPARVSPKRLQQLQVPDRTTRHNVKDDTIKKRMINRRHPGEPEPIRTQEGSQKLESAGPGH